MKFVTRYEGHIEINHDQSGQKTRTKIQEMDQCDINKIMERFNRTGQLPNVQKLPPRYGEAIAMDFATAQQLIHEAREAFMQLPATTRKHFHNDPGQYMDAIQNASPESIPELRKLGIVVERQPTSDQVLKEINANLKKSLESKKESPEKA